MRKLKTAFTVNQSCMRVPRSYDIAYTHSKLLHLCIRTLYRKDTFNKKPEPLKLLLSCSSSFCKKKVASGSRITFQKERERERTTDGQTDSLCPRKWLLRAVGLEELRRYNKKSWTSCASDVPFNHFLFIQQRTGWLFQQSALWRCEYRAGIRICPCSLWSTSDVLFCFLLSAASIYTERLRKFRKAILQLFLIARTFGFYQRLPVYTLKCKDANACVERTWSCLLLQPTGLSVWFIVLHICNFLEPACLLGKKVFAACPRSNINS